MPCSALQTTGGTWEAVTPYIVLLHMQAYDVAALWLDRTLITHRTLNFELATYSAVIPILAQLTLVGVSHMLGSIWPWASQREH
jgi:hypothetical protein